MIVKNNLFSSEIKNEILIFISIINKLNIYEI